VCESVLTLRKANRLRMLGTKMLMKVPYFMKGEEVTGVKVKPPCNTL
jgi:hypothetical protein